MAGSKEVQSPEPDEHAPVVPAEDSVEEDSKPTTGESTSKSKKKKKKSKIRNILSRPSDAEIAMAEVEEAMATATLEEKRSFTKEEQKKFDLIIKKLNEKHGKKTVADYKFWNTQPVLKFGMTVAGMG